MRETMRGGLTLEPSEMGKADEEVFKSTVHSPHTLWLFFFPFCMRQTIVLLKATTAMN